MAAPLFSITGKPFGAEQAGAPSIVWQNATPLSPTSYSPSQVYNFSVNWTTPNGTNITQVVFRLFKAGTLVSTKTLTGGGIILSSGIYYTTYTGLSGGAYTYDWFAQNSIGNLTSAYPYQINPATTTTSLTLNGVGANVSFDPNTIVNVVVTGSQSSLPVSLLANFSGSLAQVASGTGSLPYSFNVSNVGGTSWLLRGITGGNENYTSSLIDRATRIKVATSIVLTIDGPPQSKVFPASGFIATINATINVPVTVCIEVTKPDTSSTTQCGVQNTTKFEFPEQSGAHKVKGYFVGDADNAASERILYIFVGSDALAPSYSSQSQSAAAVSSGGNITFSATLSDDTFVHTAVLQTNVTGSFQDAATRYIGAPSSAVSFIYSTATQGIHGWRLVFNDSAGNQSVTANATFEVLPPTPANFSIGTKPSGANITVNGQNIGTSPKIHSVLTGTYTVGFGPIPTYAAPAARVIQVNASNIGTILFVNVTYFDPSDANQNSVVETSELNGTGGAIPSWKIGAQSLNQLITTIARWKAGSY